MSEFKWPCDLRVAHKPHSGHDPEPCDSIGLCGDEFDHCPGVKAHPATMIGKASQ